MLNKAILDFYYQLKLDDALLPKGVKVMNPYTSENKEVKRVMALFHNKYFSDENPRNLIVGINPGRFGAGITGIPFTDSKALIEDCKIATKLQTNETSADFVYQFINAYGGAEKFYAKWFIGGVCPLGFLHLNEKGNWINWNYYDQKELQEAVKPFIVQQLKKQMALCGHPKKCIVWGTGKNFKFMNELNKTEKLFDEIVPLEHPRYIMQYKRKKLSEYHQKFIDTMARF